MSGVKNENLVNINVLYAVGSGLLWMKVFFLFKFTRLLGPMIKIIMKMLWEVFLFFLIFAAQIAFFASIFNLLFVDTAKYSTLYLSIINLFDATLGNYSYDDFKDTAITNSLTAEVCLIIFLIGNYILMINLLVAILSNTYSMLHS